MIGMDFYRTKLRSSKFAMEPEISVDENTVSQLSGCKLQRQGYQVPKPSLGHGVLIGKEAVVGIKAELVPALHGSSQNYTSQLSRGDCRQGTIKKTQTWPPLPDRDRSRAAGTFNSVQVSRNARASYSQVFAQRPGPMISKKLSRNEYQTLVEQAPIMTWRANTTAECDYFNDRWLQFRGRRLEEEYGNRWTEGVHRDDLKHCLTTYLDAFEKREPFEMEFTSPPGLRFNA